MFTGIIEATGKVIAIEKSGTNIDFTIASDLRSSAYIDQSISHNGICLTIVALLDDAYVVTAVKETIEVTNLKYWQVGTVVNLERAMLPNTRLDGHFVQGHVDTILACKEVKDLDGSWYFTFILEKENAHLIVNKGSIAINGVSLTVIDNEDSNLFKVAIIPYTYEHTNFKQLKKGDLVNVEFDILGKYIAKHSALASQK